MHGHGLITKRGLQDIGRYGDSPFSRLERLSRHHRAAAEFGGIGLVQLLKMKADLHACFEGVSLNSAQYVHLDAEIEKRVFADRAQYLGDPDFYKVPIEQLTDDAYIAKRAAEVSQNAPSDTKSVQPGLGTSMPEKVETTHFSVVDTCERHIQRYPG